MTVEPAGFRGLRSEAQGAAIDGDLYKSFNDLRAEFNRGFRRLAWTINLGFSLLTLLIVLFKFIP